MYEANQRIKVDLSNLTVYEVELLFSFKGVQRVEASGARPPGMKHVGCGEIDDGVSEATMRLSEAIRLGAMMSPQAFRALFTDDGTCALGGALLAVGATGEPALRSVRNRWPWAFTVSANCPSCGRSCHVFGVITHLNDNHRWPREQIATWVAGIEPSDPCPAPRARNAGGMGQLKAPCTPHVGSA
jgi:hypothetical protein